MQKSIAESLIIEKIMKRYSIPKSLAKKLFINSLIYFVVQDAIFEQIDFLIEEKVELL